MTRSNLVKQDQAFLVSRRSLLLVLLLLWECCRAEMAQAERLRATDRSLTAEIRLHCTFLTPHQMKSQHCSLTQNIWLVGSVSFYCSSDTASDSQAEFW